jgi:hypothetical protein
MRAFSLGARADCDIVTSEMAISLQTKFTQGKEFRLQGYDGKQRIVTEGKGYVTIQNSTTFKKIKFKA